MVTTVGSTELLDAARSAAEAVTDPELPMLTLADLGILRGVQIEQDGAVAVTITPTYSGCPAMATMRDDLVRQLNRQGFTNVEVRISLQPAWSSDWISKRGRERLRRHGISAPGLAARHTGPIALTLTPTRRNINCPQCGATQVSLISEFGATACKAMYRCDSCLEPFDHVKEI